MCQLCEKLVFPSVSQCEVAVSSTPEGSWPNTFICVHPGFINRAVLGGLADAKQLLLGPPQQLLQLCARAERGPVLSYKTVCLSLSAPPQLRNFRCGEVEFVSQVGPRPTLLCLNVEEVERDTLSYLNSERVRRTSSRCQVGATA